MLGLGPDKKYSIYRIALRFTIQLNILLAPTRRRRKAGVGRTSPLSGACHLPKARGLNLSNIQFSNSAIPLRRISSWFLVKRNKKGDFLRDVISLSENLCGGARFHYHGFELVENQGQFRATFPAQPEMRNSSRTLVRRRELIRWRLWSHFKLEETTIPQES
jgi:hypothetical protein